MKSHKKIIISILLVILILIGTISSLLYLHYNGYLGDYVETDQNCLKNTQGAAQWQCSVLHRNGQTLIVQ
jgi:uncharacterized protein YxeA